MSSDTATHLLNCCIRVLKEKPDGMTTKDLVVELQREDNDAYKSLTSSVLSSKLNAIFRRLHGDTSEPNDAQLTELPLTRAQSIDSPHRLVYKFTPPQSMGISHSDDSASSEDEQLEPSTPKEYEDEYVSKKRKLRDHSPPSGTIPLSGHKLRHKTLASARIPVTKIAGEDAVIKIKHENRNLNLYYDTFAYDSLASEVSKDPKNNVTIETFEKLLNNGDFDDVEFVDLNELDKLVC